MNGQALRIFAHARLRSTLARPRPSRALPLVVVTETEPCELVAPALAVPVVEEVVERVEPEVVTPVIAREPADESIGAAIEQTILDILTSAPMFGETIDAAYRRKERELAELFESLTRSEAATLQRRLVDPRSDDAIATRFARLVVDRRTRLLAVLADAPRREARRR